MYISPPISVLAIIALMVAGRVRLAPPPREGAQISVMLPAATYQKLTLWGRSIPAQTDDHCDASGGHRGACELLGERQRGPHETGGNARKMTAKCIGLKEVPK
jgi:hypothetical protein